VDPGTGGMLDMVPGSERKAFDKNQKSQTPADIYDDLHHRYAPEIADKIFAQWYKSPAASSQEESPYLPQGYR
jgi:hypothetical protein